MFGLNENENVSAEDMQDMITDQSDNESSESLNDTTTLTERRKRIIKKYKKVFKNTNADTLTFSPGLITRVDLMKIIEEIYEKQVQTLLKTKTRYSLDLAKITRMTLKKKFQNNNKFVQKLVSLIYSAEKYKEVAELNIFLKFLLSKKMNLKYLFYLFLRQHFKIITNTNFMAMREAKNNPLTLSLSHLEGKEILQKGFYDDEVNLEILLKIYKKTFKRKKKINFYEFLTGMCVEEGINYNDLDIMSSLLALYTIKSKRNLAQISFDRDTEQEDLGDDDHFQYGNDTDEEEEEGEFSNEDIRQKLIDVSRSIDVQEIREKIDSILAKNMRIPFAQNKQIFEYLYLNRNKKIPDDQLEIILKNLDKINNSMEKRIQRKKAQPPVDPNKPKGIMKKGTQTRFKTPFQQVLSKKLIRFKPNEQEIQIEMGDELNNFVKKLVYNFIDQNDIMVVGLERHSLEAINQIYKKLYFMCIAVFMKDINSWNKILRIKDDEENKEFWEEICGLYDDMVNGEDQDSILRFLHKLFDNQLISQQVIFYLNFYFENDEEINVISEIGA